MPVTRFWEGTDLGYQLVGEACCKMLGRCEIESLDTSCDSHHISGVVAESPAPLCPCVLSSNQDLSDGCSDLIAYCEGSKLDDEEVQARC